MKIEDVLKLGKELGEGGVKVRSSIELPEGGLVVVLEDHENAKKFVALMKLTIPEDGHDLIEIQDNVVKLKLPKYFDYLSPRMH